jgi:hypothetical protein
LLLTFNKLIQRPFKVMEITLTPIGKDISCLLLVFGSAVSVRIIALHQFAQTALFWQPRGDAGEYLSQAHNIINGVSSTGNVQFLSSVLYPYFLAMLMRLQLNLFNIAICQIIIGSLGCVLMFLLSMVITGGNRLLSLCAGLMMAAYGLLIFLDTNLLSVSITTFCIIGCILYCLRSIERSNTLLSLPAGIMLGVAALDRTNILVFLPVVVWYYMSHRGIKPGKMLFRSVIYFVIGMVLVITPFALRNYLRSGDLILASNNWGVNLYIGNNPEARGVFLIPESSGLHNTEHIYEDAKAVAEKAEGKALKPSKVSEFWARKALSFISHNVKAEIRLLVTKLGLLLNAYEVPNHLNFYFFRQEIIPALKFGFVGFWLLAPLAICGILMTVRRGLTRKDILLLGYAVFYILSLLPFFVSDRYRVPLIPILAFYAAVAIIELWRLGRNRATGPIILYVGLIAILAIPVNRGVNFFNYAPDRIDVAEAEIDKAIKNNDYDWPVIYQSVSNLKWALESSVQNDPWAAKGIFTLGRAYALTGCLSAASTQFEQAQNYVETEAAATEAIKQINKDYKLYGDIKNIAEYPKTPFEQALLLEYTGNLPTAERQYRSLIIRDPYHVSAYIRLGLLHYKSGEYKETAKIMRRGLKYNPNSLYLILNLAQVSFKLGHVAEARRLVDRCLVLDKSNDEAKKMLYMIGN